MYKQIYLLFLFSDQRAILDDLMADIPLDFDFLLSERHAEVITGKEEGVYSWIAINYLLGKFDHRLGGKRMKVKEIECIIVKFSMRKAVY